MIAASMCFGETYVENWNRNEIGSNWFNVLEGKWGISGKKWLWCDNVGNPSWARQVCYKKTADDYRLNVSLRFYGEQGKVFRQRAGIASSIKDNLDNTALIVWIDLMSRKICALVKINEKEIAWKESEPLPKNINLFDWHTLSIINKNGNITILFDKNQKLCFEARLGSGRIACLAEDAHVDFGAITFKNLNKTFSDNCIFKRFGNKATANEGLIIPANPKFQWRSLYAANAAYLRNTDPHDKIEKMFLYFRGTDPSKGWDINSIGLMTHPFKTFNPTNSWKTKEEGGQWTDLGVVVPAGPDNYDCKSVLDTCVVKGTHGDIYLYYIGKDQYYDAMLGVAKSTDGGFTFKKSKNNPLMEHVGPSDVVYYKGKYYIFYGDAKWNPEIRQITDKLTIYVAVTKDPENLKDAKKYKCIAPGPEGSWESCAVGGGRIFRLKDKWWMIYQGGDTHFDFQPRFHAAYSDDLINWTKVKNDRPLFLRGEAGNWDQGAIWWGTAIIWNEKIYIIYEGWGSLGYAPNRNSSYYYPARSQIGMASCTVKEFLNWTLNNGQ